MFLLLLRDAYTWEGGRNLSSIWGRYGVVIGSRVHATVDHRGVMEHIGAGIYSLLIRRLSCMHRRTMKTVDRTKLKVHWLWAQLPVGANILGFNAVVLSVVGNVLVDSETSTVTLSISRIYQTNLKRCS
jgi:hypothetical protein